MNKNEIIQAYTLVNNFVKDNYANYEIYLKRIVDNTIEVSLKLKESRIKRPTLFLNFKYENNKLTQISP